LLIGSTIRLVMHIPEQSDQRFRAKAITDSGAKRSAIPA
jgi:hypothetical protein